jgi:hypothetical protein
MPEIYIQFKIQLAQYMAMDNFYKQTPSLHVDDGQFHLFTRMKDSIKLRVTELAFKVMDSCREWENTPDDVKAWVLSGMDEDGIIVSVAG